MRMTDDCERRICECGKEAECIDNPQYPEAALVWYCRRCQKYEVWG